jgi:deoxycytidylate deaminase
LLCDTQPNSTSCSMLLLYVSSTLHSIRTQHNTCAAAADMLVQAARHKMKQAEATIYATCIPALTTPRRI